MDEKVKRAKAFHTAKEEAIKSITMCFYSNCKEKSINSHILQKNGILSNIARDGHVMEMINNEYDERKFYFKKIGINNAFSFNCFCKEHDAKLFELIEKKDIDFNDYRSCLLFTLRTVYNEKFRKMVNVKIYEKLIFDNPELAIYFTDFIKGNKSGIEDLESIESRVIGDLDKNTESFVFKVRQIKQKEICMSAFFTYETSEEIGTYRKKYGKDKERISDLFVCLFPYKGKSIFMMAYDKQDEKTVKSYVCRYFTDNEKKLERQITNLLLFQCETWVSSIDFYNKRIKSCEDDFAVAIKFQHNNYNERKIFDLNMFNSNFKEKFDSFKRNIVNANKQG